MISQKHLDQAYEAGRMAFINHRGLGDCPLYAMGEMGRQWRERWTRGYRDACIATGQPDPLAPPKVNNALSTEVGTGKKQPIRTGRRTGR